MVAPTQADLARWDDVKLFLALHRERTLAGAAARVGLDASTLSRRLVALDNLYMYGRTDGPIRETSAVAPCSRKGELRAKLAEERATAHARGELRIATGRAPDFFGPGVVRQTTYGERFYARIFAGKSAQCLGDPSLPHSLGYAPDVARGLVTLADHDEALGEIWHLPVNEAESMSQMTARMARALGREIAVSRIPRFALHAMGLFSPLLREVAEMAYQWDAPYLVDDTKFRAAFGGSATDIDEIVTETARWAVATYAPRAAAVASRAA